MNWLQIYFAIFIMAFTLTMIFTPLCQKLAALTGYMDVPKSEQHKLHRKATPLLGGLAMFTAWIITLGAAIAASRFPDRGILNGNVLSALGGIPLVSSEFLILCLCAFAALVMGMIDDRHPQKAWVKLIGQILIAATAVTWGGLHISLFISNGVFSWCVTVFWIVFLFNAINFFDNMDGLVAGTAAIAFTFFTMAAIVNQQFFIASLSACSAAVSYGFWFFNHSPASIFMGDGGSHFIGFLLAVISAKVTYFNPEITTSRFSVLIPIFILAVPIFDALAVVAIRIHNHKPIYVGDHNHISHRFLHMGMTRKRAVVLVHLLCLVAGLGALPLLWGEEKTCMLLILQGIVILILLSLLQYSSRQQGEVTEPVLPDPPEPEDKSL